MPVIRRDDGVAFVYQPYRETLTAKKTSLLRKEINYLAQAHGNSVRLFKQPNGEYEAVFSQESGYLLGESVWNYFHRLQDLIYCEALEKDPLHVLLVVVREGKVYLDAKIAKENIAEEFASLITENSQYDIYTYGDISVNVDKKQIHLLKQLDKPLFPTLPIAEEFHLLPLEQALDEQQLGSTKRSSLMLVTIVILLVLGGLWWYAQPQQATNVPKLNPYQQFEVALQTPAPGQQLQAVADRVQQTFATQGWYPDSLNYDGRVVQIPMSSFGGTATQLVGWGNQVGMQVNFSSSGASLISATTLPNRAAPKSISNSQQVIAVIIDRMMQVLPDKSVQINNTTTNQMYQQTNLTITFNNISPEILELIGTNLNDLPVSINNCTATIQDGLLSGNLQIAVVGN